MRKILYIMLPMLLMLGLPSMAQETPTKFTITDGTITDDVRRNMEKNLFEMFKSCLKSANDGTQLTLPKTGFTKDCSADMNLLWEASAFVCPLLNVSTRLLNTGINTYEVRDIPVQMLDYEEENQDKEMVISFDVKGTITGVSFAMASRVYSRIMAEGKSDIEYARRQKILNFVEVFRTAYNKKDVKYLEQVYSDDAIIITGRIIKSIQQSQKDQARAYGEERIEYIRQDKQSYLTNLKKAFERAKFIDVKFSDIEVRQHQKNPDVYGITLRQSWTTNTYHDDGYVFLMIDFANENKPEIHVRTWQPSEKNGKPLSKDEIFSLGSFQISSKG